MKLKQAAAFHQGAHALTWAIDPRSLVTQIRTSATACIAQPDAGAATHRNPKGHLYGGCSRSVFRPACCCCFSGLMHWRSQSRSALARTARSSLAPAGDHKAALRPRRQRTLVEVAHINTTGASTATEQARAVRTSAISRPAHADPYLLPAVRELLGRRLQEKFGATWTEHRKGALRCVEDAGHPRWWSGLACCSSASDYLAD